MFHQGPAFLRKSEESWQKNNVATRPNVVTAADESATTTTTNKSLSRENGSSERNETDAIQFAMSNFISINENLNTQNFGTTTTTTTTTGEANKSVYLRNETSHDDETNVIRLGSTSSTDIHENLNGQNFSTTTTRTTTPRDAAATTSGEDSSHPNEMSERNGGNAAQPASSNPVTTSQNSGVANFPASAQVAATSTSTMTYNDNFFGLKVVSAA